MKKNISKNLRQGLISVQIMKITFVLIGIVGFIMLFICAGESDFEAFASTDKLSTSQLFCKVAFDCSLIVFGWVGYKCCVKNLQNKLKRKFVKIKKSDIKVVA